MTREAYGYIFTCYFEGCADLEGLYNALQTHDPEGLERAKAATITSIEAALAEERDWGESCEQQYRDNMQQCENDCAHYEDLINQIQNS